MHDIDGDEMSIVAQKELVGIGSWNKKEYLSSEAPKYYYTQVSDGIAWCQRGRRERGCSSRVIKQGSA